MSPAIRQVMLRLPVDLSDLLNEVKAKTGIAVNQQIINMIQSKKESLIKKINKKD
jgi:predicted HicB family RNase H-like nuclease